MRYADRAFYFGEGPRAKMSVVAKAHPRAQRSQTILEDFT